MRLKTTKTFVIVCDVTWIKMYFLEAVRIFNSEMGNFDLGGVCVCVCVSVWFCMPLITTIVFRTRSLDS